MLETITLEHIPSTYSIHIAFFRDVTNAASLQSQLLARNTDFEYALIDASTVISRLHLLSAIYKSLTIDLAGTMKTPNVHSEIVCALSSNNNISEAYRRYGIQPTTKDVIVVKIVKDASATPESIEEHLATNVQGRSVPLSDEEVAKTTDWPKLRKYHKLNGLSWLDGKKQDSEDLMKKKELEKLVVSAMALRGM